MIWPELATNRREKARADTRAISKYQISEEIMNDKTSQVNRLR